MTSVFSLHRKTDVNYMTVKDELLHFAVHDFIKAVEKIYEIKYSYIFSLLQIKFLHFYHVEINEA